MTEDATWAVSAAFWIMAVSMVITAVMVVTLRNILHAALALIVCFATVAGIYVTLRADFLALVQVLTYVGAIAILVLFGIMLTRNPAQGNIPNRLSLPAFLLSGLILGSVLYVVIGLSQWGPFPAVDTGELSSITTIADLLFSTWLLPFEVVAVLLLVALIGALVLIKEDRTN